MHSIVFLIILIATQNLVAEVSFYREGEKLFISSSVCAEAQKNVRDLSDWTQATDLEKKCQPLFLPIENNLSGCHSEISDCVPEHVRKYHGIYAKEGRLIK